MDLILFQFINGFAGRWQWFDIIGIFFAKYFEYILVLCLVLFLFKNFKKYWPMVWQAVTAAIFSRFIIIEIIRYLFPKDRPFVYLENINQLMTHSASNAFPSGHAAFYFALSTIIYFYNKKLGIIFLTGSFLISIARVFVGVHWPADILGGFLVGILCAFLVIRLFSQLSFLSALRRLLPRE